MSLMQNITRAGLLKILSFGSDFNDYRRSSVDLCNFAFGVQLLPIFVQREKVQKLTCAGLLLLGVSILFTEIELVYIGWVILLPKRKY